MLLAGVHLLLVSLPISVALIGVSVVMLLTLIRVLLSRPTVAECAAQVDREFDGRALMTTAVECLHERTDANDTAAAVVLQQARDAVLQWRPDIARLFRTKQARTGALTIIPIFVAFVLLSLPGAETDSDDPNSEEQAAASVIGDREEGTDADVDDVARIRSALVDDHLLEEQLAADDGPVNESTNLTPYRGTAEDVATAEPMQAGQSNAGVGAAGTTNDGNEMPGDALASSRPETNDAATAVQFLRQERFELQRTGPATAAGEGQDEMFMNSDKTTSDSPIEVLPAIPPASGPHNATLSPAQAAYARRYLAETGRAND
jgi:hypothetical protein